MLIEFLIIGARKMFPQYARVIRNTIYPSELITIGNVYRIQAIFEDGVTLISERGLPIYFFFDELRLIGNAAIITNNTIKKD